MGIQWVIFELCGHRFADFSFFLGDSAMFCASENTVFCLLRLVSGTILSVRASSNKYDCWEVCRQVSIEEGDAKAKEFGVMFIETSSKAGFNIKVNTTP